MSQKTDPTQDLDVVSSQSSIASLAQGIGSMGEESRQLLAGAVALEMVQKPDVNLDILFEWWLKVKQFQQQIKSCTKNVYFAHGMPRKDNIKLFFQGADGNWSNNGVNPTVFDILNAQAIWVGSESVTVDLDRDTLVRDVAIQIDSTDQVPKQLGFQTGGFYWLSDGYSVTHCWNISQTDFMRIGR